eukprot:m.139604 g.139604  ORF g.139604 m.139604 type:complete len:122 (-) comp16656_c1_seq16:1902-2267(-)
MSLQNHFQKRKRKTKRSLQPIFHLSIRTSPPKSPNKITITHTHLFSTYSPHDVAVVQQRVAAADAAAAAMRALACRALRAQRLQKVRQHLRVHLRAPRRLARGTSLPARRPVLLLLLLPRI